MTYLLRQEILEESQVCECVGCCCFILKWGEGDWGPVEDHELNLGQVEFEVPWRSQNEDDK